MLLRISKATFLLFGTGFNYLHDAPHGKDSSSGDTVAFMPITIATGSFHLKHLLGKRFVLVESYSKKIYVLWQYIFISINSQLCLGTDASK